MPVFSHALKILEASQKFEEIICVLVWLPENISRPILGDYGIISPFLYATD